MARTEPQRQLLAAYKQRPIVGGVCAIRCPLPRDEPSAWPPPNPEGQRNRFAFSVSTGACAPRLRWPGIGASLDRIPLPSRCWRRWSAAPGQTDAAFRADLEILRDIWRDKLTAEGAALYH